MNKNFKEQYLKVKDLKEEQCDCISLTFVENLVLFATEQGHCLRKLTSKDHISSALVHTDCNKVLLYKGE